MAFLFLDNMIFFLWRKMKDGLTWKYDVFGIFGKMVPFRTNMKLFFCQKSKDDLLPMKIHLKMTFPTSLKKMIVILEKMILAF